MIFVTPSFSKSFNFQKAFRLDENEKSAFSNSFFGRRAEGTQSSYCACAVGRVDCVEHFVDRARHTFKQIDVSFLCVCPVIDHNKLSNCRLSLADASHDF